MRADDLDSVPRNGQQVHIDVIQPVTILSLATRTPPHPIDQETALAVARDVLSPSFAGFERMSGVFTNADIRERQLSRPVDWYRASHDFVDRTKVYLEVALDLFVEAAEQALADAGLAADEVDTIVTISSTGIATPSLEARAMGRMGFRRNISRVPVFGLGCAGGVSGLALSSRLARTSPGHVVLMVTVELCSLALRTASAGKADVISAALFGDGAAACVLRGGEGGFADVVGTADTTWPDTLDIMGWQLEPDGLGVVLNRAIPGFAAVHLRDAMTNMLEGQGLRIEDIDRFICHPGGAKVVSAIEAALSLGQGSLDAEREVLRNHGNMSAPTALFVLDRVRAGGMPHRSVMMAFGPGFSASTVTLSCSA